MKRFDLLPIPSVGSILRSRWPMLLLRSITLIGFTFTILAGLFGSTVGSHNFAIIFVWIAWWSALKLFFIPLGGRAWCSICPIPAPGEWIQQGALLGPQGKGLSLRKRWPRQLDGAWLQVAFFAVMGLFSAVILTQPRVTGWVLLGLILLAIGLGLVFERRTFCRYLCPIGGFTGLYAQLAPVEVRVKDHSLCATHQVKTCYEGSETGYGCPWGNFPAALRSNINCGLCMECLRTCPYDNFAVNIRPFGVEVDPPRTEKIDQAMFGLLMMACAIVYSAVFLGPWGWLKSAAYQIGTEQWFEYAAIFLTITLVLVPGAFSGAVWLGKVWSGEGGSLRKIIARQSQALLPLGLSAWIAFTVSFAFVKFSYVLPVLSDPFGWGWNLLGTAHLNSSPDLSVISPAIQTVLLLGGLFWTIKLLRKMEVPVSLKDRQPRAKLPVAIFCLLFTLTMLWLLIG